MSFFFRHVALLTILFFPWGCSLVTYPPSQPSIPSTDVIHHARRSNDQIRSVRGIGRIELASKGKRVRTRQFIALEKPDMMRIDLLSFLDLPYLSLAFQDETFQAMDMRQNVFYTGGVAEGLSLFVPLTLTTREFIAFLLGEIPSEDGVSVEYDLHRRLYRLTLPPSTRWETQTFWIDPKTLRVVEVSKTDSFKREEIRVSFSHFRKTGSLIFPTEIQIDVPAANNRIRLNFQKIEINLPLSPDLFRLSIPPGVEMVKIHDGMGRFPLALPAQEYSRE